MEEDNPVVEQEQGVCQLALIAGLRPDTRGLGTKKPLLNTYAHDQGRVRSRWLRCMVVMMVVGGCDAGCDGDW